MDQPTPTEEQLSSSDESCSAKQYPPVQGRWQKFGLGLLVGLAIVLRLWYAQTEPNSSRFFDERIGLANIESILDTQRLQPENYWYQSLSYLPQATLLAASERIWQTSGWEIFKVRDERGFRPNAYHLCRATMVLWSGLSLLLTFHIGRRLFSPWVGWLGTFLLAVVPWHVITSVRFKPDGLLLLLTLLTFWWILDLVERPSLSHFLRAGLGVGLTLATKLNGAMIVIPLITLTLLLARRDPKVLLRLGLSGITAALVYLVTNPWVSQTLWALKQNRQIYARQAAEVESNHLDVLVRSATSLFQPMFHGPLIGLAVFGGMILLVSLFFRRGSTFAEQWSDHQAKLLGWVFLSFPLGQSLVFAAVTERFKENHHVQVIPFTALLAALFLIETIRLIRRRFTLKPWGRLAGSLAKAGVIGLMFSAFIQVFQFVYQDVVPTTFHAAADELRTQWPPTLSRRLCIATETDADDATTLRSSGLALSQRPRMQDLTTDEIKACDALLFETSSPRGNISGLDRIAQAMPHELRELEPSWFRHRGRSLKLIFFDWQSVGDLEPLQLQRDVSTLTSVLPSCAESDQLVSLEIFVPLLRPADTQAHLARSNISGDTPTSLDWYWVGKQHRGHLFISERLPCSVTTQHLEIIANQDLPTDVVPRLSLRRWRNGSSE